MPSRTVFLRRNVLEKLVEIAEKEGYVENGVIKWHKLLNDLLEYAIASYEMNKDILRKKRVM